MHTGRNLRPLVVPHWGKLDPQAPGQGGRHAVAARRRYCAPGADDAPVRRVVMIQRLA